MNNQQISKCNEPKSSQGKNVHFLESPSSNQGYTKRTRTSYKDDDFDFFSRLGRQNFWFLCSSSHPVNVNILR